MALSEDPTVFLQDFGVAVTAGAVSGLGILDMPGELIADGMVISTDYTLRCQTSKFGNLMYGEAVTVAGVNYQVREVRLIDDGAFCLVSMMRLDGGSVAPGRDPREALRLSDLADVDIEDPQQGDVLINDGSNWVNTPSIDGGGAG